MAQLMLAVEEDREPELNGLDHLRSIRLAEAGYRSAAERRSVSLSEIEGESHTPAP
jgi:predicted dehydrogenase